MSEAVENATEKKDETKAEKFVRLGEYRMNKAIDAIGRLEDWNILSISQLMNTQRSR